MLIILYFELILKTLEENDVKKRVYLYIWENKAFSVSFIFPLPCFSVSNIIILVV